MAPVPIPNQALDLILGRAGRLDALRLPLDEALGLALAEDVPAPEDLPRFTNSAMDGYALRAEDTAAATPEAPCRLQVLGDLPAGRVATRAVEPGTALRIMTGAPLPSGADAVVPVERTTRGEGWMELAAPVRRNADVRFKGEDVARGSRILEAGRVLDAGAIGVLAALGCSPVPVVRRARVAVLTTGNELVEASCSPEPGQIRDANIHAVCAQLRAMGAEPLPFPRVPDTREAVEDALRRAAASADLILSTGGISVGDYDFVKTVLDALGAQRHFWRVAQKPGGPLGFWTLLGKPFFGIPGNPVAAMVMVEEYVRPLVRKLMGCRFLHRPVASGILEEPWSRGRSDGKLHFLRVRARRTEEGYRISLTGPQGSGILSSMVHADALALAGPGVEALAAGQTLPLHLCGQAEDH